MNRQRFSILSVLFIILAICTTVTAPAFSADVTIRWDPNNPAPEGYRVFARQSGQSYNYAHPIWENSEASCKLTGLVEGVTYYFVVRAYEGTLESSDSAEVSYTPDAPVSHQLSATDDEVNSGSDQVTDKGYSIINDLDGDGVPDLLDRFPDDPTEWTDNDSDGLGDNGDPDDDNDGMTDVWETVYGLDPMTNDAALDADGDGVANIDEFAAESNPTNAPANTAPDAPVVDTAVQTEPVTLTPVLLADAYFDSDYDDHFKSQWQISTQADFAILVLDKTSSKQLTAYTVGKMVLDLNTVYYWRVRFIDSRNAISDWSATATFTTIASENSTDLDFNGIPDEQEVGSDVDVNGNGISDITEDTIMTVNTVEGQAVVGVETYSEGVTQVALESISADTVPDQSVRMEFGLVGFKLYLKEGVTKATVTIHFSTPPNKYVSIYNNRNDYRYLTPLTLNPQLYKYDPDMGWQEYEYAVSGPNRKSVIMLLEDGGIGDEDGVVNGIIVDPSAIAYTYADSAALTTGGTSVSAGGVDACFISTNYKCFMSKERMQGYQILLAVFIVALLGSIFYIMNRLNVNYNENLTQKLT